MDAEEKEPRLIGRQPTPNSPTGWEHLVRNTGIQEIVRSME
jgi:hypothetical protein